MDLIISLLGTQAQINIIKSRASYSKTQTGKFYRIDHLVVLTGTLPKWKK